MLVVAWLLVGLPSEMMELSIVKTVLDGIQVIGSLVGTRKDLEEASLWCRRFGSPSCPKRPVEDAVAVFDEMEKKVQIQGRMVLDFHPLI